MRRGDLHPKVRERLRRYTTEHTAHYGVVPAPPDEGVVRLGEFGPSVDRAMSALGRLSHLEKDGIQGFLLTRLLRRQEAVSSSGMEGTQSTLDAVLGVDEGTEQDAVARQVQRYASTLDKLIPHIQSCGVAGFTCDLFRWVHREIMRDDPGYRHTPGMLREHVVWIGGSRSDIAYSTWNPPGPEHLDDCLQQTASYMQCNGAHAVGQGIILRMAIAHAHFEAVHPFADGNGRVGRLLVPLMLAAEGHEPVYISPWIEANRDRYFAALKSAQQQLDPAPLAGAFAEGILATERELQNTVDALRQLQTGWEARHKLRKGSSASRLLSLLPSLPILSVKTAAEKLTVTPKAAGDGLSALVAAGIVREVTGYARNRIYVAPEVMRIVSRPFGADPALKEEDADETPQVDEAGPGWA